MDRRERKRERDGRLIAIFEINCLVTVVSRKAHKTVAAESRGRASNINYAFLETLVLSCPLATSVLPFGNTRVPATNNIHARPILAPRKKVLRHHLPPSPLSPSLSLPTSHVIYTDEFIVLFGGEHRYIGRSPTFLSSLSRIARLYYSFAGQPLVPR